VKEMGWNEGWCEWVNCVKVGIGEWRGGFELVLDNTAAAAASFFKGGGRWLDVHIIEVVQIRWEHINARIFIYSFAGTCTKHTHANAGNGYKLDSVAKYIVSKRVIKQIVNSSLLLRCRPEVGFEIQKTWFASKKRIAW